MSDRILIAYVTRFGSTHEVAEAVASTLREGGLAVDVQPTNEVRSLDGYGAVVLGTALYIGHWYKETNAFLARHREALARLPVALFALGPTRGTPGDAEWQGCRKSLDDDLARVPWLKPVAVEMFGGKYDPAMLRFPEKLLVIFPGSPLRDMPAMDVRDFTAIGAWAADLAVKLQPAEARPAAGR